MKGLTGTLALLFFGLLAGACNMNIQEFMMFGRSSSQSEAMLVAAPQAQFIYSHADW